MRHTGQKVPPQGPQAVITLLSHTHTQQAAAPVAASARSRLIGHAVSMTEEGAETKENKQRVRRRRKIDSISFLSFL